MWIRGGALNALPYKNLFRGHFDPIFSHNLDWGTKITQENFLKIGFLPKKCHFCVLLSRPATIHIFHLKFEKVIKTTQNVPKTVDNHQGQLVLGFRYQFQPFQPQKRPINHISRSKFWSRRRQKCYRNPFFGIFEPPKEYGGLCHRYLGKVKFFRVNWITKRGRKCDFHQGRAFKAPPPYGRVKLRN